MLYLSRLLKVTNRGVADLSSYPAGDFKICAFVKNDQTWLNRFSEEKKYDT